MCVGIAIAFALIVTTGGLRPPLWLQCERLSAKKRFLRCTNARSQERRASARRGGGNAFAERFDFCSANSGTKSGGRQPAVVRETHLQERCRKDAGDCRRYAHERRCSRSSEPTGGLRPPLLLQCERLSAKKRFLRCTNARSQERRASARRGAGNAFAVDASRKVRETADGMLTNAGAVAVANPRGAYAPRSCCSANVCRRKNDFCDAQTHAHKSGGRQPAVGCGKLVCVDASAFG
jgi:hypothetical protein